LRDAFHQSEFAVGQAIELIQNHVWVTAFRSEERYPGGEYMNHSDGAAD